MPILSTAENRNLSPQTGWTRDHWNELFGKMMSGIAGFANEEDATVEFPGRPSRGGSDLNIDRMESVSRSMLLAAPWMYSSIENILETSAGNIDVPALFRNLLLSGTDKSSASYWGDAINCNQRLVEMAAVGLNLYLSRDKLWNKLSEGEKSQIAAWLQTAIGKKSYDVNWVLFNLFINLFLRELGCDHSAAEIDRYLDRMDYWYSGNGWYRDGVHDNYDYYNSWTIQPYLLLWAWVDGARRPELRDRFIARTSEYLSTYKYLFAANGAYPCWGRSMIYRFAAVSVFPVAQLLGIESVSPGQARRICSGNIKYFLEKGALSDKNHLQLGHLGEYLPIVEDYSGPGSPYWAAKAFWSFLLPAEHPFWTAKEEPNEVEKGDFSIAVPAAGLLVRGRKSSGLVELYNQRSRHNVKKKYSNFCYTSHHGYEITVRDGSYCYDSSFCLTSVDGGEYIQRTRPNHLRTVPNFSASFMTLPDDDTVRVYSNVVLKDNFSIRIHRPFGAERFNAVEGGMSLGYDNGVAVKTAAGPDWQYAEAGTLSTFIRNLSGYDEACETASHGGDPKGNSTLWPNSVVPAFKCNSPLRHTNIYAVQAACDNAPFDPARMAAKIEKFEIIQNGAVFIRFADGVEMVTQAGISKVIEVVLNGIEIAGDIVYACAAADGSSCYILLADGNERCLGPNQVNLLPED